VSKGRNSGALAVHQWRVRGALGVYPGYLGSHEGYIRGIFGVLEWA